MFQESIIAACPSLYVMDRLEPESYIFDVKYI